MNQAQSGYQGFGSSSNSGQDSERDRLSQLKRTIESIEQRLASSTAPYTPTQQNSGPTGRAGPTPQPGDMQLALAEIANRQANLNTTLKPNPTIRVTPVAPQRPAPAPAGADPETLKGIEAIGRHLGDLKREIAELKGKVAEPPAKPAPLEVPQSEIDRIAGAVAEMQNADRLDEASFERLTGELEQLREAMKFDLQSAVRSEFEHSQNSASPRFTSVEERLDVLAQGVDALSRHAASHMTPRVDNLSQQLDGLRASLEELPQTLAISRLENQLAQVAERVETSLSSVAQHAVAHNRPSAIQPDAINSIESRLDEIARALVAVSNQGSKQPHIDLSAVDRVEARLADLARSVETMVHTETQNVDSENVDRLAVRIEGLTERLGSFEEYANKGDIGAAAAMFASPDTGKIEEQLRQLNDRMADVSAPPQLSQLEQQIEALHVRLEQAANTNSTSEQISGLETQIGEILHQLNTGDVSGPSINTGAFEARLANIESLLSHPQNFTLEAARQAAQQAVSMMGAQSEQGEVIAALSEDLRSLQSIAESGSRHSEQSARAVQESLEQVIDRLASIETSMDGGTANLPPAAVVSKDINVDNAPSHAPVQTDIGADQAAGPIHQAASTSGFVDLAATQVDAPSLDPVDDFEAAVPLTEEEPEDHQPLEPGSAAPDLDRLVQQASAKLKMARKTAQEQGPVPAPAPAVTNADRIPDVHPNVVETARRAVRQAEERNVAAQAAVEEKSRAQGLRDKVSKLNSGTGFDFQKFRKPIVLAVAVVLLSFVGLKGYQLLSGSSDPVRVAEIQKSNPDENERVVEAIPDDRAEPRAVEQNDQTSSPTVERSTTIIPMEEMASTAFVEQTEISEQPAADTGADAVLPASTQPVTAAFEVPESAGPAALVSAARNGDPKALFHLGMRYSEGNGVDRDIAASANWFRRSAELGFAPAQYSIGSLHEKGIGVERDISKAARWYEMAAAQGNARAMHNLAVIEATGNPPDVKPDMIKATEWFRRAASYGIKDSQFNLGILYGQGMGVPQNLSESYKWFALAAKTGDADAGKKRDEVANAMDPDDLAVARKEVSEWKLQTLDDAANRMQAPDEWHGRATDVENKEASGPKELLMKAQALLNQRGFEVGTPDGVMGPKTQKAIAQFQQEAGIPVTGKVDQKLLEALDIQV